MAAYRSEKIRVVLIDDNIIFRTIFNYMLTDYPDQPVWIQNYENPLAFLEQIEQEAYRNDILDADFLFVDINMPFMTGWELMDKFKLENLPFSSKTAIYIISSSTSSTDKQQIFNYPFIKGYIQKPVNKSELFAIIRKNRPVDGF